MLLFFQTILLTRDDNMKNRDLYLHRLIEFKDKRLIKVITGLRRSGKSTLLSLFEQHLLKNGVQEKQIIRMNFESLEFEEINTYKTLHAYIMERISGDTKLNFNCILMNVTFADKCESYKVT